VPNFATGVAIAILAGSSQLVAHHSFPATFDVSKPLKLSGTVTAIEWANPHVYFYIDVVDEQSGTVVNWAIELLSPNALARRGWSRNSMTVGDKIVVEGSAARDGRRDSPSARRERARIPLPPPIALILPGSVSLS